ncbi:MAG TPA: SPFH domain-containing protein [Mycobacteriales bacterium]|jgi:regulator of protease activity HflC (stomatin/prohibitin superfamily)
MRIVVMEWERVVRYDRGLLAEVLGPGEHRRRKRRTVLQRLDVRPRTVALPGQEVLTADGVGVRASVALVVRIGDPLAYVRSSSAPEAAFYVAVQLALRSAVATVAAEDLLASRAEVDAAVLAGAEAAAGTYGLAVDAAGVRDLAFPGELRKVFAETATAKQEARAALERARGETAALRALANAARAVEAHPGLLRLRTLQAVESAPGSTVVLTDR